MIIRETVYGPGGLRKDAPGRNVIDVREVEVEDSPPDPRDERIAALERALIEKSVITEQELIAAREPREPVKDDGSRSR